MGTLATWWEPVAAVFSHYWAQNFYVVLAFALLIWAVLRGARNDRWRRAWLRLRRNRVGMISGVVISCYLLLGALEMLQVPVGEGRTSTLLGLMTRGLPKEETYSAPWHDYTLGKDPKPVQAKHLLGTDALGNDVLVITLKACRTALLIGGITTLIYLPLGTLLGLLAGYFRRWVDDLIQYVYTVLYSVPQILLLISLLMVMGEKSLTKMALALAVTQWIDLARLIRGETLRQTERSYVPAARALGQSHTNILARHLLPNVMHLVIIRLILGFSNLVLAEAMLSFLGVGSPIGTPSWGIMIDTARGELSRDPMVWWNLTAATTALFGLVLSLNLFGDALRKAFDPRQS